LKTHIPAIGSITDTNSRIASITTSSTSQNGWKNYAGTIRCSSSSSSSSSRSYCTDSSLQLACQNAAGCSSATWSSSYSCERGDSCRGTCRYYQVQSTQCSVLIHSNASGFALSTKYSACLYPFSANNQPGTCSSSSSSSNSSMNIVFLSENDPFLAAQKITEGSLSFGLTEKQQRMTGLVLMVLGLCGIGLLVGAVVLIRKTFFKDEESKRKMYGAFGQSYNGQPVYVMAQSPYGAQQPHPGQPQYNQFGQPMLQQPVVMVPPQQSPMGGGGYAPNPYGQPQQGQPMMANPMMMQQQPPPHQQGAYGKPQYF
jgi:hypothetical protein